MARSRLNRIALAATNTPILSASPNRRAITFFQSSANNYAVSVDTMTATPDGIYISNSGQPVTLTLERDGEIVQMAWNGIGVGAMTINVLETFN